MSGSKTFRSEQEAFWAGDFGNEYVDRNNGKKLLASNVNFFSKALSTCGPIKSCFEIGANIGMNLQALKILLPEIKQTAVEINKKASEILRKNLPECTVYNASILDLNTQDWGG